VTTKNGMEKIKKYFSPPNIGINIVTVNPRLKLNTNP
jgi:hypothetical protein